MSKEDKAWKKSDVTMTQALLCLIVAGNFTGLASTVWIFVGAIAIIVSIVESMREK